MAPASSFDAARLAGVGLLVLALTGLATPGDSQQRADAARGTELSSAPPLPAGDPLRTVTYPTRTMGTYARVALVTADSSGSDPIARRALAVFARVDSLMSNWTTTSEVARLNREAASGATRVHPEVARVIEASMRLWRETGGAFDITVEPLVRLWGFIGGPPRVPAQAQVDSVFELIGSQQIDFDATARTIRFTRPGVKIDLGSIAKGYAVDVAAETLLARHVTDALVDLSGNMVALGAPAGARHWRIGIRDPRDRMPYFARITLTHDAIATAGKYEQFVAADGRTYGHIMDPRIGRPAEGLISVTVVSATAMNADAWDTPLFVLGPIDAKRLAKQRDDIAVVLVQPGTAGVDTVWVESALEDRFFLEDAARRHFITRIF